MCRLGGVPNESAMANEMTPEEMAALAAELEATGKTPKVRILLVDDSTSARNTIRYMYNTATVDIIEAGDGAAALMQLKSHRDVALVFMDVNMPGVDGITCCELIQAEVAAGRIRPVPIVMLTTEAKKDLVERAKRAGIKGWLIKPPRKGDILAITEKLTSAKAKP